MSLIASLAWCFRYCYMTLVPDLFRSFSSGLRYQVASSCSGRKVENLFHSVSSGPYCTVCIASTVITSVEVPWNLLIHSQTLHKAQQRPVALRVTYLCSFEKSLLDIVSLPIRNVCIAPFWVEVMTSGRIQAIGMYMPRRYEEVIALFPPCLADSRPGKYVFCNQTFLFFQSITVHMDWPDKTIPR